MRTTNSVKSSRGLGNRQLGKVAAPYRGEEVTKVDEEHMSDFQSKIVLRFKRHASSLQGLKAARDLFQP
jgi:hypothetical protein